MQSISRVIGGKGKPLLRSPPLMLRTVITKVITKFFSANDTSKLPPITYKVQRAPDGTPLYTVIEKNPRFLPVHEFKTNTRPPLAGPFAFSRIPRPHRDIPRVFLSREIADTWLFENAYSG